MKIATETKESIANALTSTPLDRSRLIDDAVSASWAKIAPFWPLKNLVAVNSIAGFEDLSFREGLKQSQAYFQQKEIPTGMENTNRESIKWLQAFFDEGQSTIQMPNRHLGLLKSSMTLLKYDQKLLKQGSDKIQWFKKLPQRPESLIAEALVYLNIPQDQYEQFLTLLLTTLPGWAAHVQYRTSWADAEDADSPRKVTKAEYLAFRILMTAVVWPEAKALLMWHQDAIKMADITEVYNEICSAETQYQTSLLEQLKNVKAYKPLKELKAQFVFCIDVRSEPFRRALELQGAYETYGFAGFFGLPVAIENALTGDSHASCPVLLKPAHTIVERPTGMKSSSLRGHKMLQGVKKIYQSLKYTFATPFTLVETLGLASGIWMFTRSLTPNIAAKIESSFKSAISLDYQRAPDIQTIPLELQISYGLRALTLMGLTENFAPLVVFCGHRSTTQNNAYSTALDCGACGGHHGAPNARILAAILNSTEVRSGLNRQGIVIPGDTLFVGAEHNTTTDEVDLFTHGVSARKKEEIEWIKQDLINARDENSFWRAHQMDGCMSKKQAHKSTALRSKDWAQVRPEWGLARNASFIVGPRSLTRNIDLKGRSFLHSYEWQKDQSGSSLATILTAPMVVAQWINAQYLFSSLDNVAFGGGSKVTKNITGKMGIMQGNASDLMNGLPLQSVFKSDDEPYHKPMRLTVIICAPKAHIDPIIKEQLVLQKLFGNEWVHLICDDPFEKERFRLQKDLTWTQLLNSP